MHEGGVDLSLELAGRTCHESRTGYRKLRVVLVDLRSDEVEI